jgi:hypothetical protein
MTTVTEKVAIATKPTARPARLVDLTSVGLPFQKTWRMAARLVLVGGDGDVVLAHRLVPRTTTAPRTPER